MFKILSAYGTPIGIFYREIVAMISVLHVDTCAKVITPNDETKEFQISTGILQDDTLASFVFIIVLDCAMIMAMKDNAADQGFQLKKQSRRKPAVVISHL